MVYYNKTDCHNILVEILLKVALNTTTQTLTPTTSDNDNKIKSSFQILIYLCLVLWHLNPLSTIFQLHRGNQFHWWRENQRPVASHWQTLSHNVVSSTLAREGLELTLVVISTDCIGSYKSNYHMITTTTGSPHI